MTRLRWASTAALAVSVTLLTACTGPSTPQPTSPSSTSATSSTAIRPVSSSAPIPPVSAAARQVGLVDVRSVVPSAIVDLRYATPHNFVGIQLYPTGARCLVHESLADGLRTAAAALRTSGDTLVFWDCYRPHSVQQTMFEKVPDPAWVAAPGPYSRSHESGRSVDVTLATPQPGCPVDRRIADQCLVDMGTDFDSFTPQATAFATEGVPVAAQRNRARLRAAMSAGGLSVYSGEWWHFDGAGADVARPIIDVPVT